MSRSTARRDCRCTGGSRKEARSTASQWPGLNENESDLTMDEFLSQLKAGVPGPPVSTAGTSAKVRPSVAEVIEIVKILVVILGVSTTRVAQLASQVYSTLQNRA